MTLARARPALAPLVVLLAFAVAGCGEAQGGEPVDPQVLEQGRQAYIGNCARCHQEDGTGFEQVYPNLAGNPIVTLHDPNPTIEIVVEGRGGMPGFGEALNIQELAQIITYIRNAWGNQASPIDPAQAR